MTNIWKIQTTKKINLNSSREWRKRQKINIVEFTFLQRYFSSLMTFNMKRKCMMSFCFANNATLK